MAGQTLANFKMIFGADTSGLEKGAKQAKQAVKDFDSTAQGATDAIANMFGVDTGAIEKMTSSLRGLGENLKNASNEGVKGFGNMLSSISGVTAAIAGIGIGAAIAGFRLLTSEAENFKNTVAGANIEMQTAAYISTYSQVLHDMNSQTGKNMAEFESTVKKTMGRVGANIKASLVGTMTGKQSAVGRLVDPLGLWSGLSKEDRQTAKSAAEEAEAITKQINDLELKRLNTKERWAQIDVEIADLELKARDNELSVAERLQSILDAKELIKQRSGEQLDIERQLADLYVQRDDLAENSLEDTKATVAMKLQALNTERNMSNELRSLMKLETSLSKQAASEAAARQAAADAAAAQKKAIADSRSALGALDLSTSTDLSGIGGLATGPTMEIVARVKPVVDESAVYDFSRELEGFITSAVESISSSIGGLIRDLVTGGDAWGNFSNAAISSLGDLAIAVGKLAISTGVTTLGIKKSLESLNGYVAIAAGAALVALGASIKSGLSNIASGNYNAGSSVASAGSSSSYGGNGYAGSNLNVRVTGTLKADGDQLQAVINNTTNRNLHTT